MRKQRPWDVLRKFWPQAILTTQSVYKCTVDFWKGSKNINWRRNSPSCPNVWKPSFQGSSFLSRGSLDLSLMFQAWQEAHHIAPGTPRSIRTFTLIQCVPAPHPSISGREIAGVNWCSTSVQCCFGLRWYLNGPLPPQWPLPVGDPGLSELSSSLRYFRRCP